MNEESPTFAGVFTGAASAAESRLDRWLVSELARVAAEQNPDSSHLVPSRAALQARIVAGAVTVNGTLQLKASTKLINGDCIVFNRGVAQPLPPLTPYNFPLVVLYEDNDLIVIDKPAGLTVHPGSGTGNKTLVNALVAYFAEAEGDVPDSFSSVNDERPGIVHRLDKDTSGVIVVAKSRSIHEHLAEQFHKRTTHRRYIALAISTPRRERWIDTQDSGEITTPIGRDPHQRVRQAVNGIGARNAETIFVVDERMLYGTLLSVTLRTGRTHQIRVHFASVGAPLVGDAVYGADEVLPQNLARATAAFGRQALHAAELGFTHPRSGAFLSFVAPLPSDMQLLIEAFRGA